MARIRTIKPEFPQSESMGRVSREARLLFVMLWTISDDEGRARAAPRMLASLLYPYDDDAPTKIDGWLAELAREGSVQLYTFDGNAYLQITKWTEHQRIDKPSRSRLPAPREKPTKPRERSRARADASKTDLVPRTKEGTKDLGTIARVPLAETPFEKFYHVFPRKIGRRPAEKAFNAAVKRGADPAEIIAATIGYAVTRIGQDERFTPHPATWLNRDGWLDDLENPHDRQPAGKGTGDAALHALATLERREEQGNGGGAGNFTGRGSTVVALPPPSREERADHAPFGGPRRDVSEPTNDDAGEIPEIPDFLRRVAHVS